MLRSFVSERCRSMLPSLRKTRRDNWSAGVPDDGG